MGKATDRFLDIHILARDGYYDFGANIKSGQSYQSAKAGGNLGPKNEILVEAPIGGGKAIQKEVPKVLPDKGFIAMGLKISELTNSKKVNDGHARLISWVSDPEHKGKLRINSHGAGAGRIYMHKEKKNLAGKNMVDECHIGNLPQWLKSHTLQEKPKKNEPWLWVIPSTSVVRERGLVTICLCLCHAADKKYTSGNIEDLSCVDTVALLLKQHGFTGIEVTGAMNTVTVVQSREQLRMVALLKLKAENNADPTLKEIDDNTDLIMGQYPKGSQPGQWLEKNPNGNGYRRLAKSGFKICKIS